MELASLRKKEIFLDLYQGAYGLTLRIDVQCLTRLRELRDLFDQLAKSKVNITSLSGLPRVRLRGFGSLVLRSSSLNTRGEESVISFGGRKKDNQVITWDLDPTGWRKCVDLVEGLIGLNSAGHQYLTDEGDDDILIELAFKE